MNKIELIERLLLEKHITFSEALELLDYNKKREFSITSSGLSNVNGLTINPYHSYIPDNKLMDLQNPFLGIGTT